MRRAAIALAVAASVLAVAGTAQAAPAPWVTAWAGAQQQPGPLASLIPFSAGTGGRTVRDVVRVQAAGARIRIRLTNLYGSKSLTFEDVRAGLAGDGAAVRAGTTVRVTFGGRRRVRLGRGATVTSDPIARAVRWGDRVAISAYSSAATGTATTSGSLLHTNYISELGDFARASAPAPFTTTVHNWFYAAGVEVQPSAAATRAAGAIVAFGASGTAGQGATADAFRSWPDVLGARLHARRPAAARPVLNAGVSGNALHASSPCFGQSAVDRFSRDVLGQRGVSAVIVDIGLNDLLQPRQPHTGVLGSCDIRSTVTTPRMIELYRRMIGAAHRRGLTVIGVTLTPFGGSAGATPVAEAQRQEVNAWLRSGRPGFDALVDADRLLADPADPARLRPAYDSGDHLHPGDAGYAALGAAIPLAPLLR